MTQEGKTSEGALCKEPSVGHTNFRGFYQIAFDGFGGRQFRTLGKENGV